MDQLMDFGKRHDVLPMYSTRLDRMLVRDGEQSILWIKKKWILHRIGYILIWIMLLISRMFYGVKNDKIYII